jgi:uncharacterized protein YrrD
LDDDENKRDSLVCRSTRNIVGLPIIDLSTGDEIGTVKECVFDKTENCLLGLISGSRGCPKDEQAVRFGDLKSIGEDVVVVDSGSRLLPADQAEFLNEDLSTRNVSVLGKRVISDKGRQIGTIRDVILDAETGSIVGWEVSEGIIQDILSGRNVIPHDSFVTIGEESVIIPEDAAEALKTEDQDNAQ